jgi:aminobenzoyl-glutamate utilization protein B
MQNDPLSTARIGARVDAKAPGFIALADRVWAMPELRFEEHRSAAEHVAALEAQGFKVTRGIAGIETAFMGEAGEGDLVIGFLGEFDALAGLSQDAGLVEASTETPGANGHGCGHNLLGAASLLAAVGLRDALADSGIKARVRYYGCPAEEGGSGKTFMARDGAFDDLDAAFCWHPCTFNGVMSTSTLANVQAYFRFTGRAAHAALAPHIGRSALDAIELMNVGVNYLREHMPSDARVHYAITDTGGVSPNVVQASAEGLYLVRAAKADEARALFERVRKIADGAALMTETEVSMVFDRATSNVLPNRVLETAMHANLTRFGPPAYDDADFAFAARLRAAAITDEDVQSSAAAFGGPADYPRPLHDDILPLPERPGLLSGSTDVGDVSWIVPTAQCETATAAIGTQLHTWQMVAQGRQPYAHKAMVLAAKVMAATAADAIRDPDLLAAAKAELKQRTGGRPYVSPLPNGLLAPTSSSRR